MTLAEALHYWIEVAESFVSSGRVPGLLFVYIVLWLLRVVLLS